MTTIEALARCVKRCPKCGETKALSSFSVCRARRDGRQWACKACERDLFKARREKDPEGTRAYMRRRYANAKAALEANERMEATVKALARRSWGRRRGSPGRRALNSRNKFWTVHRQVLGS